MLNINVLNSGNTSANSSGGGGGSGTPGGSNTQVQFNDAGSFGGVSGATSNGITMTLTTPVITGLPTGSGVASDSTVSTLVSRDSSGFSSFKQINLDGSTSGAVAIKVPAVAGTGTVFQLPSNNGTNGYALKTDGSGVTSWQADAAGTGDVVGPASATDGAVALYDGTTGKLIKNSVVAASASTVSTFALRDASGISSFKQINLDGSTSGNVSILAPAVAGTTSITLPTSPTNGYGVITNGSGVWSYAALPAATTPGGSTTQVQFNDGGAFGGSSTLTYNKATGELISTGTAIIEKTVTANTSTAYTVDPANGKFFDLTLTGNCTLTVQATLTSSQEQEFSTIITQDGTGGRTLTISGVTWDAGSAPIMPSAAGASLSLTFVAHGSDIIGYAAIPTGSSTSSIAVGSAVSLTTATVAVITQLDLSAGGWLITANPTFLGTGVTASEQVAFLGTASGTSTTGQDTANTSYATPPVAGSTANCTASISYFYNAATATTIYLKAKATFTIGTSSAYGSLTAIRIF